MTSTLFSTDEEILDHLAAGNEQALNEIYHKYWQPLFISAFALLKDKQACEDIIQDIFIQLWQKRKDLLITISLKSYLYAATRYQVFRQLKNNTIHQELFENIETRFHSTSPEAEMMHKELIQQINVYINALPEKCQEVYKLSREEQLNNKEIGLRLSISVKTVENHMTKALSHLRKALGGLVILEAFLSIFKN